MKKKEDVHHCVQWWPNKVKEQGEGRRGVQWEGHVQPGDWWRWEDKHVKKWWWLTLANCFKLWRWKQRRQTQTLHATKTTPSPAFLKYQRPKFKVWPFSWVGLWVIDFWRREERRVLWNNKALCLLSILLSVHTPHFNQQTWNCYEASAPPCKIVLLSSS